MYKGLIDNYKDFFKFKETTVPVTLNEGRTPLIRSNNLEKLLGIDIELYFKFEGLNPTGSFKDRGMTSAVTKAVEDGSTAVICASTGNTSASAAAYAARAGLKSYVIIPDGKIAKGKLAQAVAYGATIIAINGNFDQALDIVKEISNNHPITMVNSLNPHRIEGQKTAAFELCDDLEMAPDYLFIPVGNAGNITAYWKGFNEYFDNGTIDFLPKMMGFQAYNSAPLVLGHTVTNPETVATAIRIGNPASKDKALVAIKDSNGIIDRIKDEDILKAQFMLSTAEGIFAEPASCISLAGLIKSNDEGRVKAGSKVVCILTGNGLKDSDIILDNPYKYTTLNADYKVIEDYILRGNE